MSFTMRLTSTRAKSTQFSGGRAASGRAATHHERGASAAPLNTRKKRRIKGENSSHLRAGAGAPRFEWERLAVHAREAGTCNACREAICLGDLVVFWRTGRVLLVRHLRCVLGGAR